MKNLLLPKLTCALFSLFALQAAYAQCDSMVWECGKHITDDFISDGQVYRALIHNDEVAEFRTTLFGGSTYRIAACSGTSHGNLIFTLRDHNRDELFNSAELNNTPYWDFKIKSTVDCIIEARLDPDQLTSGCAIVLIGFK